MRKIEFFEINCNKKNLKNTMYNIVSITIQIINNFFYNILP
jgi:hypothetical protein